MFFVSDRVSSAPSDLGERKVALRGNGFRETSCVLGFLLVILLSSTFYDISVGLAAEGKFFDVERLSRCDVSPDRLIALLPTAYRYQVSLACTSVANQNV